MKSPKATHSFFPKQCHLLSILHHQEVCWRGPKRNKGGGCGCGEGREVIEKTSSFQLGSNKRKMRKGHLEPKISILTRLHRRLTRSNSHLSHSFISGFLKRAMFESPRGLLLFYYILFIMHAVSVFFRQGTRLRKNPYYFPNFPAHPRRKRKRYSDLTSAQQLRTWREERVNKWWTDQSRSFSSQPAFGDPRECAHAHTHTHTHTHTHPPARSPHGGYLA